MDAMNNSRMQVALHSLPSNDLAGVISSVTVRLSSGCQKAKCYPFCGACSALRLGASHTHPTCTSVIKPTGITRHTLRQLHHNMLPASQTIPLHAVSQGLVHVSAHRPRVQPAALSFQSQGWPLRCTAMYMYKPHTRRRPHQLPPPPLEPPPVAPAQGLPPPPPLLPP